MSLALKKGIERLEDDRGGPGTPRVIVATCPMPGKGPPSIEAIEQWLADVAAHIAFKGRAVVYDKGRRRPLLLRSGRRSTALFMFMNRDTERQPTPSSRVVNLWRTWW
jgi:hypothetical protein